MTLKAVERRLRNIWAVDWKKEAEKLLEERKFSGNGPVRVFVFFSKAKCLSQSIKGGRQEIAMELTRGSS